MSFEKQLAHIRDKAEFKAWIDELPDGIEGVAIIKLPAEADDKREHYRYREIGPITIAQANYMVDAYKWMAFRVGEDD